VSVSAIIKTRTCGTLSQQSAYRIMYYVSNLPVILPWHYTCPFFQ